MKVSASKIGRMELAGIFALGLMVIYFLTLSWRRWPDPVVDFGPQCYAIWRLSQGANIYHDFIWNYGPASLYFDAGLFRLFGPGIMVLAIANLVIYAAILTLGYIALRMAWGPLSAFAGTAVFIAVFSFSHLLGVGNYNYVTPYSPESTHGILLILVAALLAVRWCRQPSFKLAFFIGLCGGLSAVMKPEFMLAMGALAIVVAGLRLGQKIKIQWNELGAMFLGGLLPTVVFMFWFARNESLRQGFIDASQAWWAVIFKHEQTGSLQQGNFLGFDHPARNLLMEIKATASALVVILAIYAVGWISGRSWSTIIRLITVLALSALMWFVPLPGGWIEVGRCFPGLLLLLLVLTGLKISREAKDEGKAQTSTLMAFILALLAIAMMARMPLFARIYQLGFFQAALAGMVIAAAMIAETPRFVKKLGWAHCLPVVVCSFVLGSGCFVIAKKSHWIRVDQIEPVGEGRDRFYSTTRTIDGSGAVVNWVSQRLVSTPADSTVLVLPEGLMINYLSRRRSMEPYWAPGEPEGNFLQRMTQNPPDYVVIVTRDLSEFNIARFGAPGNLGYELVKWVANNYSIDAAFGGDPLAVDPRPGALIAKRKPK